MLKRWTAFLGLLFSISAHAAFSEPAVSRLHSFGLGDAAVASPSSRLLQVSDGALYGTSSAGGQTGQGTLFRLNPDGSGFALVKSFGTAPNDGARPFGVVIEGSDGTLYGTTEAGGQSGLGTIFKLGKDGN